MIFRKNKKIRELENYKEHGLPLWHELYWLTQPQPQPKEIGERLMDEFKKRYNIGENNKIEIKFIEKKL